MANYQVTNTTPTIYLDKGGKAISGFSVSLYFPEFDEVLSINVPSLALETVKAAGDALYNQRVALAKLGQPSK
jgi:hypothetical protein